MHQLFVVLLADPNKPPSELEFPVALGVGECYYCYANNPQAAADRVFESAGNLAKSRTAHVFSWGTFERLGVFHREVTTVAVG